MSEDDERKGAAPEAATGSGAPLAAEHESSSLVPTPPAPVRPEGAHGGGHGGFTPVMFPPGPSLMPQGMNISVGSMTAEAALLQRLPQEAVVAVVENSNKLAQKTLDLQDAQLKRKLEAKQEDKKRAHELVIAREDRDEGRWNKLFAFAIGLCLVVVVSAAWLYHDGHVEEARALIGALVVFAAGFIGGRGYERRREKDASEKDKDDS